MRIDSCCLGNACSCHRNGPVSTGEWNFPKEHLLCRRANHGRVPVQQDEFIDGKKQSHPAVLAGSREQDDCRLDHDGPTPLRSFHWSTARPGKAILCHEVLLREKWELHFSPGRSGMFRGGHLEISGKRAQIFPVPSRRQALRQECPDDWRSTLGPLGRGAGIGWGGGRAIRTFFQNR